MVGRSYSRTALRPDPDDPLKVNVLCASPTVVEGNKKSLGVQENSGFTRRLIFAGALHYAGARRAFGAAKRIPFPTCASQNRSCTVWMFGSGGQGAGGRVAVCWRGDDLRCPVLLSVSDNSGGRGLGAVLLSDGLFFDIRGARAGRLHFDF